MNYNLTGLKAGHGHLSRGPSTRAERSIGVVYNICEARGRCHTKIAQVLVHFSDDVQSSPFCTIAILFCLLLALAELYACRRAPEKGVMVQNGVNGTAWNSESVKDSTAQRESPAKPTAIDDLVKQGIRSGRLL